MVGNSALGTVVRIAPGRAENWSFTVIAATGEILGINTAVCVKQWILECPRSLVVLNTDLNAGQFLIGFFRGAVRRVCGLWELVLSQETISDVLNLS